MKDSIAWWMYIAGFVTPFILAAAVIVGARGKWALESWLDERGWFVEWHDRRSYDQEKTDEFGYRDFDKRNNILWANKRGPVFWGHWCRQDLRSDEWVVTRWIGFGNVIGRSVAFYRKRSL